MGGRGQHRVLGRQPALPRALAPARHTLGDARRAHDPGLAELHQHRSRGMGGEAAGDAHRPQLVVEPAVFSSGHAPTLTGGSDGTQECATSNVSLHTTACTGPSNSAFASLMTSSRDVHGGMWVRSSSETPALAAARPASVPDRCSWGGRDGESVHDASHRNTSAPRARSISASQYVVSPLSTSVAPN